MLRQSRSHVLQNRVGRDRARSLTVLTSPGIVLFTMLVGVLVVVERPETLISADQANERQRIVLVHGASGTVTPSVPRHAAWSAVGSPERHEPAGTAPEIGPRSQMAASYLVTDLARGTPAVSAHVGTTPLQPDEWDVRWGLMEMAAAQRRDWSRRCPCRIEPMARLGRGSVGHAAIK